MEWSSRRKKDGKRQVHVLVVAVGTVVEEKTKRQWSAIFGHPGHATYSTSNTCTLKAHWQPRSELPTPDRPAKRRASRRDSRPSGPRFFLGTKTAWYWPKGTRHNSDERLQAGTSKSTTAPSLLNDSCRLAWRAIILDGRLVRVVQNEGVVSRYEVRYDAVLVAAF
ncbi:hypothetical protein OOU_Y34scaffold00679g22 [Pyricularia oryzae Y34]|uniref:Uncharacterized protein n=2 Tax=Pyricularia oryzae TaxID=318829 RepID=A0AA97NTJ6_PYRO3|nr:hypothetical protein OOU_Y34scaffold00679g22 [Pyricularia oryzae Y34]